MAVDDSPTSSDSQALIAAQNKTLTQSNGDGIAGCPVDKHWIEIVLQDDLGKRIPNEQYVIFAPDGRKIQGSLDADGFARVEGLTPGQCQVSFPNLYKRLGPHYIGA